MEVYVRDEQKRVEIWLTNAWGRDKALLEQLKSLYEAYAKKHYTVVVFFSGAQDLCAATSDLLCYNRKRTAQREQRQREAH